MEGNIIAAKMTCLAMSFSSTSSSCDSTMVQYIGLVLISLLRCIREIHIFSWFMYCMYASDDDNDRCDLDER